MAGHQRRHANILVIMGAVFLPATAGAQQAASFDDLQRVVKPGQTVIVTDARGHETKGRLGELSPSSLVVLTPEARPFPERAVARIRRTDRLWNGILIGAAIGGAAAGAGILATRGESDDFYTWGYIGSWLLPTAGAVSGALLDRATTATIYVAPSRASAKPAEGSPAPAGRRTGLLVTFRF